MKDKIIGKEQQIFAEYSVPRAVAVMAIPTVISQLISVVYNLADTWYVGLTDSAIAVAAVSLCLPVYRMLTALGNLFGIGGASVIARALGKSDAQRAKQAFSAAVRWSLIVSAIYSVLLLIFARPLLMLIGGDADNIRVSLWYAYITVVVGGVPTVLSIVLSHLIRSTGQSEKASIGITLGAVLNIALDPLFMFVLLPEGNEVIGAAIATALSNLVALVYYIIYIVRNRDTSIFTFAEKTADKGSVLPDVVKSGLPSFALVGLSMVSNCFLNGMIGTMGSNAAVAGLGVVRKIDAVAYAVNQGITQGMLPIVAYCFAQKNFKRMKEVIAFSSACTVTFSVICSICSYIFAPDLIRIFIRDSATVEYGAAFLRVLCIAVAIYPMVFVFVSVFQAVGQSKKPFILSVINKGSFDVVLFFIIKAVFGVEYILWAAPTMSTVALIIGAVMIVRLFHSFRRQEVEQKG